MDRDISPEEKLLRLIKFRSKKENEPSQKIEQSEPQVAADTDNKSAKKPDFTRGLLAQPIVEAYHFKTLILLNKILAAIFVLIIAYFVIDYFLLPPVTIDPMLAEEVKIETPIKGEPVRKPYSYYENEIRGKDMFRPLIKDAFETEEELDIAFEDVTTNLSLLGVVSGDNPQAIIEDKRQKKTFFLSKGDMLGDVRLKDILELEGKVILVYRGKEFVLGM